MYASLLHVILPMWNASLAWRLLTPNNFYGTAMRPFRTGLCRVTAQLTLNRLNNHFKPRNIRIVRYDQVVPRIGSLCWKSNAEIQYDPRVTKIALTMDDLVERFVIRPPS